MKNTKLFKICNTVTSNLLLSIIFVLTVGLFSGTDSLSQPINVPISDTPALIQAIEIAEGNPDQTTIILGGGTYSLTAINNNTIVDVGLPIITTDVIIEGNNSRIHRSDAPGTPEFSILIFDGDTTTLIYP